MPIKLTVSQPAPVSLSYVEAAIKPEVTGHVTPTYEEQTVYPAAGTTFGRVEVDPIPDPTAIKEIDSNGDHDVRRYGTARVDVQPKLQNKTATPTEQAQTILPDTGYDGLESVNIARIPTEYIIPTGTKDITTNGTHDVTDYAFASVSVQPNLQTGEATPTEQTQTITPDGQHDGFSSVTVNPIPSQYIVPTGTKQITANGTGIDVSQYASVDVDVNTLPEKGYVLSDYDSDGFPTKAELVGDWTETPTNFTTTQTSYAVLFTHITQLKLPGTLASIGYASFANYHSLEKINIPSSVTIGGTAFAQCRSVTEINIGGDLTFGGINAFNGLTSCKKIVVGGNVTNWQNPFSVNSAQYASYVPIELYDFSHCTDVFSLSAWYQLSHANGCVIRVPQSLLSEWQSATNWNALTGVVWEGV